MPDIQQICVKLRKENKTVCFAFGSLVFGIIAFEVTKAILHYACNIGIIYSIRQGLNNKKII